MRILITFLTIGILNLLFLSCSMPKRAMEKRFKPESVPKDIMDTGYVLLVKIPFYTKAAIRYYTISMNGHYKGKYILVPPKEPIDKNYPDLNKYKYILQVSISTSSHPNDSGHGRTSFTRGYLYIEDRTNSTLSYYSGLESSDIFTILKFYADKLSGK